MTSDSPGPKADADPYRELFERSADAILIIEGDRFVDCNQATVEMLRYRTREEVLRKHPSELSPPTQPDGRDSYEKANEMIDTAFAQGSHRFEWHHVRADGEVFPVEVLLTAVRREGTRILHVVWRDITDRKRLEEQLRHSQKMEAIGKLAGGVAHDFNNLLVVILGNTEMLQRKASGNADLLQHVDELRHACDRATTLVRQLLTFSRKQEMRPRVIDLATVLTDLDKMLGRLIGEHVELSVVKPSHPVRVKTDPGQMEQVIVNLVTNARDAMPSGGTVTIELKRVKVEDESIGAADELRPGPHAVLAVTDSGMGMDEETLRRAFDPFFTTKNVGEGTGLGLSNVYGVARQGGGTVTIHSIPGHGTTVKVYLPITLEEVYGDELRRSRLPSEGGVEQILVAEDENAVSRLVVDTLRDKGYHVLLARDGTEALELYRRYRDRIELVLTDVVMPGISGPELIKQVREDGSSVPVLFISGYTNDALRALDGMNEAIDLLEKPFSASELTGRVRLALDRAPSAERRARQ